MKNYTSIIKRTGKKYYQSYKVVETSRTFDISLISRSYVFFKNVYGLNLLRTRCRILTLFFFLNWHLRKITDLECISRCQGRRCSTTHKEIIQTTMKGSSRRTNDMFVNTPVNCAQVTKTDSPGSLYCVTECMG